MKKQSALFSVFEHAGFFIITIRAVFTTIFTAKAAF